MQLLKCKDRDFITHTLGMNLSIKVKFATGKQNADCVRLLNSHIINHVEQVYYETRLA